MLHLSSMIKASNLCILLGSSMQSSGMDLISILSADPIMLLGLCPLGGSMPLSVKSTAKILWSGMEESIAMLLSVTIWQGLRILKLLSALSDLTGEMI